MEFIKRMKKREFIEMGLKTIVSLLAAFLAIILMEGMIYGIELNSLKTKGKTLSFNNNYTVLYCLEESDDQYFIIAHNPETDSWSAKSDYKLLTKAECEALVGSSVKEVKFNAPNAFEFSITGTHYIVMAVFVMAVAGFFVYKFIALAKEYKHIEEVYEKTGTIEINNI